VKIDFLLFIIELRHHPQMMLAPFALALERPCQPDPFACPSGQKRKSENRETYRISFLCSEKMTMSIFPSKEELI